MIMYDLPFTVNNDFGHEWGDSSKIVTSDAVAGGDFGAGDGLASKTMGCNYFCIL